jgi:hypothetical protein
MIPCGSRLSWQSAKGKGQNQRKGKSPMLNNDAPRPDDDTTARDKAFYRLLCALGPLPMSFALEGSPLDRSQT